MRSQSYIVKERTIRKGSEDRVSSWDAWIEADRLGCVAPIGHCFLSRLTSQHFDSGRHPFCV